MEKITTVLDTEPEIRDEPGARTPAAHRGRPAHRPRHLRLRPRAGAARDRHPRARRAAAWRSSASRAAASRRPRSSSAASTTPTRARVSRRRPRPARARAARVPPPARRRAPGPVPLRRHDRRQHPLRPARGDRRGGRGRRARGRRRPGRAPLRATGLLHEVREGGAGLSAGERQLISIARALLADPRILILDEATSNIDRPTEILIEQALDRLLRGRTSIIIAHRLATVRRADEILVIEHGRIAPARHVRRAARGRRGRSAGSRISCTGLRRRPPLQSAPVDGQPREQLGERRELGARVAARRRARRCRAGACRRGLASFAGPSSVSFAYETRASEAQVSLQTKPARSSPSSRRVIPDAVSRTLLGEIDAPQPAALGVREVQQHLVVVQRQAVLALQLRRELAGDRRVRAQERNPGLELLRRLVSMVDVIVAPSSVARRRPVGPPDRFSDMGRGKGRGRNRGRRAWCGSSRTSRPSPGSTCSIAARRDLRLPRPERRRQVDDRPHADDAAPAHGGPGDRRRLRRRPRGPEGARRRSAPRSRRRRSTRS